jgi:hypothetical protein
MQLLADEQLLQVPQQPRLHLRLKARSASTLGTDLKLECVMRGTVTSWGLQMSNYPSIQQVGVKS